MSAPALQAYVNGSGQVSGDNLNTLVSSCDNVAQLRAFTGLPGIEVYVRGFSSINDGGQGHFYWNTAAGLVDNGTTVIVPSSAASGGWSRSDFTSIEAIPYTLSVPTVGFNITVPNNVNAYVINPAGTLASGTFVMPAAPYDGQKVKFSTSQTVTTLTVSANSGQTLIGAPSTITSIAPFTYLYTAASKTWYRI